MIWSRLLFASFTAVAASTIVNTVYGPVEGHKTQLGNLEWLGIPYASPPVGNLRLADPIAPATRTEVYKANVLAPGCPQSCGLPPGSCPETTSEDCLYLNVWAPEGASNLPVFVWIHGGAFTMGAADVALYWGGYLADEDIVVVSLNYRLGALGFYATEKISGNWGIKDQRLALEWVQQNIAGFGGNPKDVTIAGQSAGAMSVGCHLTSPASAGLFHKAILESNPWALPYKTSEEAADMASDVAKYAGCRRPDDLECLRSLSVEQWLDAQDNGWKINRDMWFDNFVPFGPVVDGSYLPLQPFYAVRDGKFNKVPLLTGSVSEDGVMFVYELFTSELGSAAYEASLKLIFGRSNAKKIDDLYPSDMFGNKDDTRDVISQLGSDLLFACADINATIGAAAHAGVQAWSYFFTEVWTFEEAWGDYDFCKGRVCHGSELPYVFRAFSDGVTTFEITPAEEELVRTTMGYWVNFVKSGNPNGDNVPQWPEYTSSRVHLELNEPVSLISSLRQEYCNLWNNVGYFW